jgi:hypothetical protein
MSFPHFFTRQHTTVWRSNKAAPLLFYDRKISVKPIETIPYQRNEQTSNSAINKQPSNKLQISIMSQPIIQTAKNAQPTIRSALKKLHAQGISALKPHPIIIDPNSTKNNGNTTRQKWKRPAVSRRVANDLRKAAIRSGTYGTYDPETGIGWDKSWDEGLFGSGGGGGINLNKSIRSSNNNNSNNNDQAKIVNGGKINWMEIRGFKETKRERTRESRAQRIEALLNVADDKIVEYRQSRRDNKPEGGIENVIKRMVKRSTKK